MLAFLEEIESKEMKHNILLLTLLFVLFSAPGFAEYKTNSVLSSGKWIKVSTQKDGIHKITYKQLENWGISSPANVSIYSNGGYMLPKMNNVDYPDDLTQISVFHSKDNDNNDAVFFYSTGNVKWEFDFSRNIFLHEQNLYSAQTFFYITSDGSKSAYPENKDIPEGNEETTFNTFNDFKLYEYENINLLKSGRRWFSDEIIQSSSKNYTLNFSNTNTASDATLTVVAAAESSTNTYLEITVNNNRLEDLEFSRVTNTYGKATDEENDITINASNQYNINLSYVVSSGTGTSWIDYLIVNQTSNLVLDEDQLSFRQKEAQKYTQVKYQINSSNADVRIWDISNPLNIKNIDYSNTSNSIQFIDLGGSIAEYVIFNPKHKDIPETEFVSDIENQNIHGLPIYDFVIVSHPDFLSASETLADYHRENDDMTVLVLSIDEIFNEFSSGLPDVSAIRNMSRMFYKRKTESDSLRYLLLMGDGSYNNRDFNSIYSNYIPTYQSKESLDDDSFVSDDYFALLDDNEGEASGLIDIGIGRIPCQTLEEAEIVVNKTTNYLNEDAFGDWRNVVTFLADDEDYNQHMSDTESLVNIIESRYPGFYADKIYFDAYSQITTSAGPKYPDVTEAINQRVEEGTLILNYMGHANEISMAHEDVLTINDIQSWGNKNKLPVFVTATCEFSRFDDNFMTAGEEILFNGAGGGVALFSTTRLVYASANAQLSRHFYNSVFMQDSEGNNFRMGDIMRRAKNNTSGNNKRNFSLLGDPALKLAFPQYHVETKKINNVEIRDTMLLQRIYRNGIWDIDSVYVIKDTIKIGALDKVTVNSEVVDHIGNKLSNFNGTVTAIVYDKAIQAQTLANDGGNPYEYTAQSNIIYKGTSTVTDGEFEFTFIVPKDIAYNIDMGKIYYYTHDGVDDGNGAFDVFSIGGTSENPFIDNSPPEVSLYLNNESFNSFDKVSSSALLMINMFDESGINTVGTGIGHDIVATLDGDYSNPIVLNDYYSSQLNSYQHGQVLFPLNNLSVGEHILSVKVWDVQNNSTVEEISFIVEEGFEITSVLNYPNPVEFDTKFLISHNLPGDNFDVNIEIFTLRGMKVHEIQEPVGSYGTLQARVRWDITDTNYPLDKERILVYRVTMENAEGLKATGAGKLFLKNN